MGKTIPFQSIVAACDAFPLFVICLLRNPSALRGVFIPSQIPLSSRSGPYLPPFKGFVREDAIVPGHQRVDGLIEALGEPGVVVQLSHALSAGTRAFVEKVHVLEEVERRVPERVTEKRGERDDAK